MHLVILGANGGVGRHLVAQAAAAGHTVRAVARPDRAVPAASGVDVVRADVLHDDLDPIIVGADAVLSALGIARRVPANPWSALTGPADFTSRSAARVVDAMQRAGVRRLIAVSAAGVADSAPRMNPAIRAAIAFTQVGVAYADLARMEAVLGGSGLDVLCVRPVTLTDGPPTGRVVTTDRFGALHTIRRADVAGWMLAHASGPLPADRAPMIRGA